MTRRNRSDLVLGFHPTARGFGWALFDGPNLLLDWGLAYVQRDKNAGSLRYLNDILERYRPDVLVLERFDRRTGKRASRVGRLCSDAAQLADGFSIDVAFLKRGDIHRAVGLSRRSTRHEAARLVADHIEALRHRLPAPRRPWDGSDRRMALFSAAALALAHYAAA